MILENTIRDILDGNDDAYSIVVSEYQQQIFAYVYRMVKNYQDAEDLTQDTFIRAFNKLSTLKDINVLKSWIYQIAYRTTINYLRKQKIKSLNLFSDPRQINDISCEVDYSIGEYGELATKIFASLNSKEHSLLTLRAIEEMSYTEISEVMGVSSVVLRKRYERLIDKLYQAFLQDKEANHES